MRDPSGGVLVVIPARGGSKGLPGKNLATVSGVSLVARAVLRGREFVARAAPGDHARVVVDTDDPSIADEARRWGASVPFLRPAELAADDTSTVDSVTHLLGRMEGAWSTVVLLQPTSPLAVAADVTACWARYRSSDLPSVVSTVALDHPPALTLTPREDGALDWWSGSPPEEVRRQGHTAAVRPSGAVYVVDTDWFVRTGRFIEAGRSAGVPIDPARAIDVDEPADLARARTLALLPADSSESMPPEAGTEVLDGVDDLQGTLERVVDRIVEGRSPSAVRIAAGGLDGLVQVPAVRSIFGLPVIWDPAHTSRDAVRAARMLGARIPGHDDTLHDDGDLEPAWFEALRNR